MKGTRNGRPRGCIRSNRKPETISEGLSGVKNIWLSRPVIGGLGLDGAVLSDDVLEATNATSWLTSGEDGHCTIASWPDLRQHLGGSIRGLNTGMLIDRLGQGGGFYPEVTVSISGLRIYNTSRGRRKGYLAFVLDDSIVLESDRERVLGCLRGHSKPEDFNNSAREPHISIAKVNPDTAISRDALEAIGSDFVGNPITLGPPEIGYTLKRNGQKVKEPLLAS